jgi:hypothetical protein
MITSPAPRFRYTAVLLSVLGAVGRAGALLGVGADDTDKPEPSLPDEAGPILDYIVRVLSRAQSKINKYTDRWKILAWMNAQNEQVRLLVISVHTVLCCRNEGGLGSKVWLYTKHCCPKQEHATGCDSCCARAIH